MCPRIFGYQITSADVLKGPLTLLDGQASLQNLVSFNTGSINFVQWQFSVIRNGITLTGRLLISSDGVNTAISVDDVWSLQDLGISFFTMISGSNLVLQYMTTSTGHTASLKYYEKSWI